MCLIITNSYLSQLLFKLFFTVTQPDQSSVNISLFLSRVCVRAHKSKADACPLRSSAQQVDSEDGASLSLSLTRPLVEETPRGAREKERECVGETERWTDDSKRRWKWEKCSLRPYILDFSYFVLFVPSKRCWCDEQGGGRDWHH